MVMVLICKSTEDCDEVLSFENVNPVTAFLQTQKNIKKKLTNIPQIHCHKPSFNKNNFLSFYLRKRTARFVYLINHNNFVCLAFKKSV